MSMPELIESPENTAGGMPSAWTWRRIPRVGAGRVVTQLDEHACGPACGEMLLRDRGYEIDQGVIAGGIREPFTHELLAARMTELSGLRWLGGAVGCEAAPTLEIPSSLCATRGSWAALLQPDGFRHVGHWVVVDAVNRESVVLVRDPAGRAYGMLAADFLRIWSYSILVIQEVSP